MTPREEPLTRRGAGYELPVTGSRIDRVCFSGLIDLEFKNGAVIRIGTPFRLKQWGHERTFHPRKFDTLQPVLSLVGMTVVSATAAGDGSLDVQMDDGATQLHVDRDAAYESWEFRLDNGVHLVSRAGGGLVLFDDRWRKPGRQKPGGEVED